MWPVIDMFKEQSSGFSGAFGRQVTLSPNNVGDELTAKIVERLEWAAGEGTVALQVSGVLIAEGGKSKRLDLSYDAGSERYRSSLDPKVGYTKKELFEFAKKGEFSGTFTGRHGAGRRFGSSCDMDEGFLAQAKRGSTVSPGQPKPQGHENKWPSRTHGSHSFRKRA